MKSFKIIQLFLLLFIVAKGESNNSQTKCPCGYPFTEEKKIKIGEANVKFVKKSTDDNGSFGIVKHAYWIEGEKCVAVKRSSMNSRYEANNNMVKREVDVLEYFKEKVKEVNKKNYIIKMIDYAKIDDYMYIVLELEGKDLVNYFNNERKGGIEETRTNEDLIIKLIKGAALALEQFHKFGIHGDVRPENFVVSLKQNPGLDFIEVKIIDFNISIVGDLQPIIGTRYISRNIKAPELNNDELTREADIWAFGLMVYRLFHLREEEDVRFMDHYRKNKRYNTKIDRIIKACIQRKTDYRATLDKVLDFLDDEHKYFPSEEKEIRQLEKERIEQKSRFINRFRNLLGFAF